MQQIWFTISDLSQRWQKSPDAIERLLRSGKLLGMKMGGSWRVHESAVAEYESPAIKKMQRRPEMFRTVPDVLGRRRRRKARFASECDR